MGGVTWFLARAGAGRRLRSGLGLVLLVGLTGAVVLAAWAGARRTATTYERLQESVNQADFTVATEGDPAAFDPTIAVDGPGVAKAGIAVGYPMAGLSGRWRVDLATNGADRARADASRSRSRPPRLLLEGGVRPTRRTRTRSWCPMDSADEGHTLGSRLRRLRRRLRGGDRVRTGRARGDSPVAGAVNVAPLAGAVRTIDGGVLGDVTVMFTAADAVVLPALSVARAVRL